MHITVNTWLPNCMHMYVMIVPVRTVSAVNMYQCSRCSFIVWLTVLVPFGKVQPVIFHFLGSISSLDVTHPSSSHNTLTKTYWYKKTSKVAIKAFQMELEQYKNDKWSMWWWALRNIPATQLGIVCFNSQPMQAHAHVHLGLLLC